MPPPPACAAAAAEVPKQFEEWETRDGTPCAPSSRFRECEPRSDGRVSVRQEHRHNQASVSYQPTTPLTGQGVPPNSRQNYSMSGGVTLYAGVCVYERPHRKRSGSRRSSTIVELPGCIPKVIVAPPRIHFIVNVFIFC